MEKVQKNGSSLSDEALLRAVLDSLFAFVGLFSLGGIVLDSNEAPVAASGLDRNQVVGRRFIDLPWFADSAAERARIAEAIAAAGRGERIRLETWIHSARSGERMCIDAIFAPLRDGRGTITHVAGSGVDVSARKRAEKLLATNEARLLEAQRMGHIGSWEHRLADGQLDWSDELYRIYGAHPGDFKPSYELFLSRVHPDDREHTISQIRQSIENTTPFAFDHRILRPDGSIRVLHTNGEVLTDGAGLATRVVGSSLDVTDLWDAQHRLEHTVSTLRATLEATADGILVGDKHGRVAILNQRLLALWRLSPDVGPGSDIHQLAETVRDQLVDGPSFMNRVTELYGVADKEAFDVLRFADGRVYERYSAPQRMGSSICGRVCSFRDVTRRERLLEEAQTERATAEAARRSYETFLGRISDGYVALDRSWRYVYVNTCAGRMLGREAQSLIGKHIWTEFPEGRGQKFQLAYEQAMREQRPVQLREHYEPWDRWFENRIYPSEEGISILFTDVTEQVRAQEALRVTTEQLRALAARVDTIREEERRRIAYELHDQIGQALTAIKLDFAWLRGQLPSAVAASTAARVAAMDALVDQTLESARQLSTTLRPAILDDLGLTAAIVGHCRDFEQRTGIHCATELPPDADVPGRMALTLFRILQEALTNVARHARAHNVRVTLAADGAAVTLVVADDGRGATPEELGSPTSLGVAGMRERVLAIGGALTVVGVTERGTTVTVRVPTAEREAT